MKVWVGGDSLSVTPGESFVNQSGATQVISVLDGTVDGHVATGLARPEVFNWPDHMAAVIADQNPDALVLTLGSNDDQTLTGDGGVGPFGTDAWIAEYRRRVGGMMDALTANSKRVLFWVGVPIMRNLQRSEDRYRLLNQIIIDEAAKRAGHVVYIDTYDRFSAPGGGYADYLDGVLVRTQDGIHFNRAGGDRLAGAIIGVMGDVFDLESWKTAVTTTTLAPTATTTKTSKKSTTSTTQKP